MDIVTKKKLNILIQLAQVDKEFASSERDMVYQIARERKFSEEAVTDLIVNPEPIGSLGALSQEQKFDYLLSAVEMVFADHKVLDSEIIFTKSIAIKLGFRKGVVDYLVENYKNSPEDLKKRVIGDYMLT